MVVAAALAFVDSPIPFQLVINCSKQSFGVDVSVFVFAMNENSSAGALLAEWALDNSLSYQIGSTQCSL